MHLEKMKLIRYQNYLWVNLSIYYLLFKLSIIIILVNNIEFRIFLQEKYKLGIPLAWGPSIFPLIPYPVKLGLEVSYNY